MLTIDLTNQLAPLLQGLQRTLRPGAPEKVMERALVNRISDHLFKLNAERPNKLGGPRTNFYSQAARSVSGQSQPGEVVVSISHVGFRQRLEGGVIRPVRAKMLTIPAVPEAHGKRAGEFHNLRLAVIGGRPALVETQATRIRVGRARKDGTRKVTPLNSSLGNKVIFWLARSVNQAADPTVLPTTPEMAAAALDAVSQWLDRRSHGGAA